MLRALIIDDEIIGINTLKVLIEKHVPEVNVVATTTDPAEGITLISNYKPDIVFLDVSMPKMDAFELLDRVAFKDFKLVFTTAHAEYALKAIKSQAHDYLLKPIVIDELVDCIRNISRKEIQPQATPKVTSNIIELSVRDGIIFIKPNDVIRLEASGSYTTFYLENNVRHVASKNLKECETMLHSPFFYRCHPSHIVNLKKVVKLVSTDGLFAQMTDGSMPEITRKNKEAFLERLKSI
jgi:two-component system, LytTR family, response regulator